MDATPAYRCAVALHPANKFAYFELEWTHNKQWVSEAKRVVQETYAKYEEAAMDEDATERLQQTQEEENGDKAADDAGSHDLLQQVARVVRGSLRLLHRACAKRNGQKLRPSLTSLWLGPRKPRSRGPSGMVGMPCIRLPGLAQNGLRLIQSHSNGALSVNVFFPGRKRSSRTNAIASVQIRWRPLNAKSICFDRAC